MLNFAVMDKLIADGLKPAARVTIIIIKRDVLIEFLFHDRVSLHTTPLSQKATLNMEKLPTAGLGFRPQSVTPLSKF
jgi:hypothetical protein